MSLRYDSPVGVRYPIDFKEVSRPVAVDIVENLFVGKGQQSGEVGEIQIIDIKLTQPFFYLQNVERIARHTRKIGAGVCISDKDF